jgi:hypothetical protein
MPRGLVKLAISAVVIVREPQYHSLHQLPSKPITF